MINTGPPHPNPKQRSAKPAVLYSPQRCVADVFRPGKTKTKHTMLLHDSATPSTNSSFHETLLGEGFCEKQDWIIAGAPTCPWHTNFHSTTRVAQCAACTFR